MLAHLLSPFADPMLRHALIASICLSFSGPLLGVFLVARKMALAGDVLSHGLLPGIAIAFAISGMAFIPMTLGAIIAGLLVITVNILIKRHTPLAEDASFAGAYLISLAVGVIIITASGGSEELVHILFGDELQIKTQQLDFITAMSSLTLIGMAVIYRGLIVECVDSVFMKSVNAKGGVYHYLFLVLVVLNLVAAFQALGTLMSLGLILLPAIAAKFWSKNIDINILISIVIALISSTIGLILMFYFHIPGGPAAVVIAGGIYILSIIFGRYGVLVKLLPHYHSAD